MATLTLPGLIDMHVHLRDPGELHKEDFTSGTSAALAGGFTTIVDMPNNQVAITTKELLDKKITFAQEKIVCDVGFYFGSLGDNLTEFEKVKDRVLGLKLFLNKTTGNYLLNPQTLASIFMTFPQNLPILVHAQEDKVKLVLDIMKNTPRPVHFCHISMAYELKQITDAKNAGLPVTCGVTPHHLFLTEEDAKRLGPFALMKPELKTREDVSYLWQHFDEIDVIESDHAPHAKEEKQGLNPPYGIPGLETTLPLLLTAMAQGRLTAEQIIEKCHTNPQKILQIAINPRTYVEVDTDAEYTIENANLRTKAGCTPFDGWHVKGKVARVFSRGTKVYEDGVILTLPGSGHIVTRQTV